MDLDRESIRRRLPHNLDELAKETGALRRRREVSCAEQLLWMALMYSGMIGSLRGTAALGARTGDFDINDTSVRYRLKNSEAFLQEVLNYLLLGSARCLKSRGVRRRICLQDATVLSIPGSKGADFRLHTLYVPGQGLAGVELTDGRGGERLERSHYEAGDIVLADQGLAHARDLHHVHETGAYSLLRLYLRNIVLQDLTGKKLLPNRILDLADQGVSSVDVLVPYQKNTPLPARLVIRKLPPEQAGRAREKLRRQASKKQKVITDDAMRLAGYVVVISTLPTHELTDHELLETYRLRWQIELFFKRCKSIMKLDELVSAGKLARSWILGKLIIAALVDRAIVNLHEQSNRDRAVTSQNLWRLSKLCFLELNAAVAHVEKASPKLAHLFEAPRQRSCDSLQLDELYEKLNPSLRAPRA